MSDSEKVGAGTSTEDSDEVETEFEQAVDALSRPRQLAKIFPAKLNAVNRGVGQLRLPPARIYPIEYSLEAQFVAAMEEFEVTLKANSMMVGEGDTFAPLQSWLHHIGGVIDEAREYVRRRLVGKASEANLVDLLSDVARALWAILDEPKYVDLPMDTPESLGSDIEYFFERFVVSLQDAGYRLCYVLR